jgi:hypothetical protein
LFKHYFLTPLQLLTWAKTLLRRKIWASPANGLTRIEGSLAKPNDNKKAITSYSIETDKSSRPAGQGEVGNDVASRQTQELPECGIHLSSSGKGSGNRRKETGLREPEGRANSLDGVPHSTSSNAGSSEQGVSPSLDYSVKSCGEGRVNGRNSTLVGWVNQILDPEVGRRRRGRAFHRSLSGIKHCRYLGKNVYFLTLTSSKERGYEFLKRDWIVLLKRCREFFGQFDYYMIKTHEGNGVIHLLFHSEACQSTNLDSLHSFFSMNWAEIHKAPVVWICKTYGEKRLAGYLTQYLASQEGETRMSWSWGWVHRGFVHDWEEVKRNSEDIKEAIKVWDWYLANEPLWLKARLNRLREVKL